MKFSALIAAVAADWNGVSEDNSCGSQISADSMVNSTCTVSGSNIKHVFAGNGAFITGPKTFTGFDDISGDVDVIVFFDQTCDEDGNCNNSTCWDAAVNCVSNGEASSGVFFMESVNDHRGAKGGNINLQISGVKQGDTLSIDLAGFACQNITALNGVVTATEDSWGNMYSDSGAFSVQVNDQVFGDLFQITIVQQPGQTSSLNLWESSISN